MSVDLAILFIEEYNKYVDAQMHVIMYEVETKLSRYIGKVKRGWANAVTNGRPGACERKANHFLGQ